MSSKFEELTNLEFVAYLMNFSANGGLTQSFIIEALDYYSKFTLENIDNIDWPENHFIKRETWKSIAQEVQEAIQEKYHRFPQNSSTENSKDTQNNAGQGATGS
jgi:hypothetical protein